MKLNRRGFFGTVLGAAAAGPAMAQEAVKMASGTGSAGMWTPIAPTVEWDIKKPAAESLDYIVSVVKRAHGIKTDRQRDYAAVERKEAGFRGVRPEVECLKSVSAISKHRMSIERHIAADEERGRMYAAIELMHDLKIPRALWDSYL